MNSSTLITPTEDYIDYSTTCTPSDTSESFLPYSLSSYRTIKPYRTLPPSFSLSLPILNTLSSIIFYRLLLLFLLFLLSNPFDLLPPPPLLFFPLHLPWSIMFDYLSPPYDGETTVITLPYSPLTVFISQIVIQLQRHRSFPFLFLILPQLHLPYLHPIPSSSVPDADIPYRIDLCSRYSVSCRFDSHYGRVLYPSINRYSRSMMILSTSRVFAAMPVNFLSTHRVRIWVWN